MNRGPARDGPMLWRLMRLRFYAKPVLFGAVAVTLGSCSYSAQGQAASEPNTVTSGISSGAVAIQNTQNTQDTPSPLPTAAAPQYHPRPTPAGATSFTYDGELIQGGWIRGRAPADTLSARLGNQTLKLDADGYFFAAFDRDAKPQALLQAQLANGESLSSPLAIAPRAWNIERINLARNRGGPSSAFMRRRRPELAQIHAARAQETGSQGWKQDFIWPVKGRISGRFGSQRIYAGVAGSYHSGIDIATGRSGTPYVAPADGVVVLSTKTPFSLEGYLLIIDHGQGLNSAFLHNSRLAVGLGDTVRQGQTIGYIGSTGSATGPHLHWSIKWNDARLDPLLFTGPMR